MASFRSTHPSQVQSYWPEKVTVTLFGNGVCVDAIKMRSYGSRMGPNSRTAVLLKRDIWRQTHTEGKQPCEDGGGDWSDASTNQGVPGVSALATNWERGRNASFRSWKRQEEPAPRAPRGGVALPTPGSVFWPPDWERIISVVFSHCLWYSPLS